MLKYCIVLCLCLDLCFGLLVHEHHSHHEPEEETEHHHDVDHKHATSHQSVKIHHYHAVPVYIKKEDQHLAKKPIDIGGTKQKLKLVHPKSELSQKYGLVLENEAETDLHGYHDFHHSS